MGTPVCFVEWLHEGPAEAFRVAKEFSDTLNMHVDRVDMSAGVFDQLSDWAAENDNTQALFLSAHGRHRAGEFVFDGLFDGNDGTDWISWLQLGVHLAEHLPIAPAVCLGACGSAAAASVWSEHILRQGRQPAAWLVAFEGQVPPVVVEEAMCQMLHNFSLDPVVFVEHELPSLRRTAGNAVQMFYPAATRQNRAEYVSIDDFEGRVGIPFADFVRNAAI